MTLTESGAQGIALRMSQALTIVIQSAFVAQSDADRFGIVDQAIKDMTENIEKRVRNDQLPGDPTKADVNSGPPTTDPSGNPIGAVMERMPERVDHA